MAYDAANSINHAFAVGDHRDRACLFGLAARDARKRRISVAMESGMSRQPQAFACAMCHFTRACADAWLGMGCSRCHRAFMFESSIGERSEPGTVRSARFVSHAAHQSRLAREFG
jgi:hypothetical protein